jgi:hypothetical protein
MTKPAKSPKAANNSAKDLPTLGAGFREIGIAAVAAAVRCQRMALPDDERTAARVHDSGPADRLP